MSGAPETLLLTTIATQLALGMLGSGHCVAMCGGIACALGAGTTGASVSARAALLGGYQLGRLASYASAGAIAGTVGIAVRQPFEPGAARVGFMLLQALALIVVGLHIAGLWRRPLAAIERTGARFWGVLAPLRRVLFPVRGPVHAIALGALWGWLPCGLVYSALLLSLGTGTPGAGAIGMLAFGLGTLPAMLAASVVGGAVPHGGPRLRRGVGALLVAAGTALGVMGMLGSAH